LWLQLVVTLPGEKNRNPIYSRSEQFAYAARANERKRRELQGICVDSGETCGGNVVSFGVTITRCFTFLLLLSRFIRVEGRRVCAMPVAALVPRDPTRLRIREPRRAARRSVKPAATGPAGPWRTPPIFELGDAKGTVLQVS
jgi:hypothetical protein